MQTSPAEAKLIASSIFDNGIRVDTLQLRYWRAIHAEFMTHRDFTRNASSSRAIPIASILLRNEVFVPQFNHNQKGMQPAGPLSPDDQMAAEKVWRWMADTCKEGARILSEKDGLNVHKQYANRPLEWFSYIDVLVTSTRWSNWDGLRRHKDAQGEIRTLADAMFDVRSAATPRKVAAGDYHLPYVTEEDREAVKKLLGDLAMPEDVAAVLGVLSGVPDLRFTPSDTKLLLAISAARCCRVSYALHDGKKPSISKDMILFLQLAGAAPLHASPLEHQCRGLSFWDEKRLQGNLLGAVQFRKLLPYECL